MIEENLVVAVHAPPWFILYVRVAHWHDPRPGRPLVLAAEISLRTHAAAADAFHWTDRRGADF